MTMSGLLSSSRKLALQELAPYLWRLVVEVSQGLSLHLSG
jgi:hypothetical protein